MGDLAAAQTHLQTARALGCSEAEYELESLLLQAQTPNLFRVEGSLRALLPQDRPEIPLIVEGLIHGYLSAQQWRKAYDVASVWADTRPAEWYPRYLRGLAVSGSHENAATTHDWLLPTLDDLRSQVEKRPECRELQLTLAKLYQAAGKFNESIPHYQSYLKINAHDANAVTRLCRCQRWAGQGDEALLFLERWLKQNPDAKHPGLFLVRGQLALDAGRLEEAEAWLRRSYALSPKNVEILHLLSQVCQRQGNKQDAEKFAKERKTSEDGIARASEISSKIRDIEAAGTLDGSRQANLADLYYDLACAYLHMDDRKGLIVLRVALRLNPEHQGAHRKLAEWEKGGLSYVTYR